MRAKGLNERRKHDYIFTALNNSYYSHTDIQACYLAKKANTQSSWNASEKHREISI